MLRKYALHFFEELALFPEPNWTASQTPLLAINLNEQQQWSSPQGQAMTIGVKPDSAGNAAKTANAAGADYLAAYYLDKGESLKVVAENHGVSEEALRETNKLNRRQTISLGQRLLIPLKQLAANSATKKTNVSVLFKAITGEFDLPHPRL
ncbi:MAG: LysM domain-containing protein [Methyloglobulus sp.]|nr:LysM domain-containing protein [Methyloglobulus sp.]